MDLSSFELTRLTPEKEILPFDCGDSDLNDFLLTDSKNYYNQLLAVTYLLEKKEGSTVAFFSVLNDRISYEDVQIKSIWRRFKKPFPHSKSFKSYPSVKIGRFGVSNAFKGQDIGTALLDYIKYLFINNNRTGCRFITVDAYRQSLPFYEKNQFKYLTENDKDSETRLMYFDLSLLK